MAVLTNGSLLWDPEVRKDISNADLVVPSLDAGDEETFRKVNRPVSNLTFEKFKQGLIQFSREYKRHFGYPPKETRRHFSPNLINVPDA